MSHVPAHQHSATCECYHQAPQPPACSGHHYAPVQPAASTNGAVAAKWLAAGVGGSFLALSLAISFIAVAIGAVALTVCLLILRQVWQQMQAQQQGGR